MSNITEAQILDAQVDCVDNVISIKDVTVKYGSKEALKKVSIDIKRNSITAFIGPSGCGKTTLLKSINRMNDLVKSFSISGTIHLDNENIYDTSYNPVELRKKVGMVFQQPNPLPTSIINNLKLPINEHYPHLSNSDVMDICIQKLKDAHLYEEVSGRLNESSLKISGGQQQRLCIARALTVNPEVILFDEPCSALDPISTMKIEELLEILKEKLTIVIVTHNLEQAVRIADYAAFFYEGDIIEQGISEDIFMNPKNELTQKYLTGRF